jgi:SPP1 gp7 family putative phage head morphogenesis protein
MATPFQLPNRFEVAYRRAIHLVVSKMLPTKLESMSPGTWISHLRDLSDRASFIEMATSIARGMVLSVNVENTRSWREASQQSQGSQYLYSLLQKELKGPVGTRFNELVERQSQFITDIPRAVASRLSGEIAAAQQRGARPESIVPLLHSRFPALTNSRIQLLARTGVSSSSTLLTEARCDELDLPWFTWYTSKDQRVRPSHRNMDGVLVSWRDLPSPEALIGQKPYLGHYAPGDCPNCRCGPLPVLTVEDVFIKGNEQLKVYHNGTISRFTKAQFTRLSGVESRKAA